jgi:SnoaL-like domain
MNAPERLWRGLAARDWDAVRSQFRAGAVVEWPHTSQRLAFEDYIAARRERPADRRVEVARVVTEGRCVVVEARVGDARGVGLYDLHDGLISGAVEYWVGEGA